MVTDANGTRTGERSFVSPVRGRRPSLPGKKVQKLYHINDCRFRKVKVVKQKRCAVTNKKLKSLLGRSVAYECIGKF